MLAGLGPSSVVGTAPVSPVAQGPNVSPRACCSGWLLQATQHREVAKELPWGPLLSSECLVTVGLLLLPPHFLAQLLLQASHLGTK